MEKVIVLLNHWGETFSSFTGAMLLQTTVLILVLGIGDFIVGKRLRSTVRYAIWMLLLLKLVLPVTLSLPTGLMRFKPPSPKGQSHADQLPTMANNWIASPGFRAADVARANELPSRFIAPTQIVAAIPRRASDAISLSFRAKLLVGWMVGVTGLAICMILRTQSVCALAASGFTPSAELSREFELCVRRLRINARVSLRLTSEKIQPGIYGLFTPVVLLPTTLCEALESVQIRAIFLHELTHLKRGDLFVNLVQTAVQVLYFYNPLLWVANRHIRRIREEAVDEAVLISMGEHASCYASTLVNVAKLTLENLMGTVGTIGILESDSSLGIRVKRMLSRPFPSSARVGIRGCVITAVLGLILLPMAPAERLGASRPAYATNDLKGATAKPKRHESFATNSINPLALLKTQSIDELFRSYEAYKEMRKRSQKATAAEILSRPNAIDFLAGKLKRNGSGSYSEMEEKSRVKAIALISNAGPRGIAALPSLIAALEDPERIRRAATLAIGDLGPSGSAAIPILKEELRFQNSSAAEALFKINPNSTETLNLVLDYLQDNSTPSGFRSEVLNSLWLTQLQTPRLLAVLNALPEENPALKEDVSRMLEKFHPVERRSPIPQFPRNKYEKKDLPALIQRLNLNISHRRKMFVGVGVN